MPRTRSLKWSELKIGIMAVVALLIAAALILALGGEGGFFWQRYNLKVKFPNAGGVQEGRRCASRASTVGAVQDMRFSRVRSRDDSRAARGHAGAGAHDLRATIGSVSLLGEGAVDISARTDGSRSRNGATSVGAAAGQLADVTAQAIRDWQTSRPDEGAPGREGHGRQADDRRAAVPELAGSSRRLRRR